MGREKDTASTIQNGAIIHAVVWSDIENDVKRGRVQLENGYMVDW